MIVHAQESTKMQTSYEFICKLYQSSLHYYIHIRISNLISSLQNFQETCNAAFGGFISTTLKSNKEYAES